MDKWIVAGLAGVGVLLARAASASAPGEQMTYSAKVMRFAQAIAKAEGFYSTNPNVIPRKNHNPGDLKKSSVPSIGSDAQGHLIFATDVDGWTALYRQVQMIVDGTSQTMKITMTIAELAKKYAESSGPWATIVARELGVSPLTPLREVLT